MFDIMTDEIAILELRDANPHANAATKIALDRGALTALQNCVAFTPVVTGAVPPPD